MHEAATSFPSREGQQQLRQGAKPSPTKLINKPAIHKSKTTTPVQQQARPEHHAKNEQPQHQVSSLLNIRPNQQTSRHLQHQKTYKHQLPCKGWKLCC
jgi:hypothetical protein